MKFCPECAAPTGASSSQGSSIKNSPSKPIQAAPSEGSSNKAVWNVLVVCITVAILMWPHGIFGITMIDRAAMNCEYFDAEWAGSEDECVEWKEGGIVYVALLMIVALLFLLNINKSPKGSSSDESPQVPEKTQKNEKEKTESEIIKDKMFRAKFGAYFSIIALFIALQYVPLFTTLSADQTRESREKSSLNYLLNCEIDEHAYSWEDPDRYCTEKAQDQGSLIRGILLVLAVIGLIFVARGKVLITSDEQKESEGESNDSISNSNN